MTMQERYLALTEKRKIPEVIVVEGKDDTVNLKRYYEVDTYDYNGERIRKIIMQEIPQAKHAFLNRGEAVPKSKTKGRSLGVEHASFEDLEKALAGLVGSYEDENFFDITKTDLMRLGLLMGNDSRKRREYLGEELRIGYCNGKQLIKRLELFGISLAEVEDAMKSYENN